MAPDGSIVELSRDQATVANVLSFLEPSGRLQKTVRLPAIGSHIFAVAEDATTLLTSDVSMDPSGSLPGTGILAVDASGGVRWARPVTPPATITGLTLDTNGTVLVLADNTVEGLDLATGATRWQLALPPGETCVKNATLTSSGALVVQGCTLVFGAGD